MLAHHKFEALFVVGASLTGKLLLGRIAIPPIDFLQLPRKFSHLQPVRKSTRPITKSNPARHHKYLNFSTTTTPDPLKIYGLRV
jgi:hypothetical protein